MARGKKKESAPTLEEKLVQALVPDWKQPYKVPKNWIWSYIRSGYEVTSSKRVHKNDWLSEGIPFYRTRELVKLSEHGYVDNELFISEEQYEEYKTAYGVPQMGDLLISGVGTIGVPYIVDSEEKFYFKDGNIIWFMNKGLFLPKYIYFLYKSLFMYNQIHEMSSGITVDTYTIINANNTMVPVPSLSEQQRIVDRIEYLFAKLDEAKEKAQSVLDSFETRKAAILHKAFTGELTAKWRAEHGEGIDSWRHSCLKDICDYMKAGGDKPADFVDEQDNVHCIPVVANGISNEGIIGYSAESKYDGETVTVSGRGTIGYSIYRNYPYYPVVRLIVLGPKKDVYAKFLKYAFDAFPEEGTGSSIPQLTVPMIKEKVIPVPCIEEQAEIVRIIDSLFAKEQQAKEAAEAVLEKIDLLKKSILARAFRGDLGTNDPTEESALALLKQVLQEDVPAAPKKRSKSIPKELQAKLFTELECKIVKLYFKQETDSLPAEELLSVSSKKFEVMEALRNLEQRRILKKLPNGNYRLLE